MIYPIRRFPASMAFMSEVMAHTAELCKSSGLTHREQMRVELAIEELFTNTVRHGYGDDSDQPVWIEANNDIEKLCITYQDAAPAYNPLGRPNEKIPPPIGGLGVTLVENFAHTRYQYKDGRNTLILTFMRAPG